MDEQHVAKPKQNGQESQSTEVKFNLLATKWINLTAKHLSGALAQGQAYMAAELKKLVQEDLEKMKITTNMEKFDKTIQEAKKRSPVNERVVTTPEQVMRGVSCKEKVKEGGKLRVEFERIKNENELLLEKYASLAKQVKYKQEHLRKDLEKYTNGIDYIRFEIYKRGCVNRGNG
ncbi:uncharacterized protein EV154DRAFT_481265 [Mucor mucedo]|uniref:uncharacterized protein n=1 Tax=Mucor mucedo TaxID=29922 RepID=UPI0022201470|nr:uncharacterized protein EV154DRAFT_481265 [Mucor mucedo]KAI7891386.1 hypothetical protein EV154DRAFT_481265 [Mucor mucedo]